MLPNFREHCFELENIILIKGVYNLRRRYIGTLKVYEPPPHDYPVFVPNQCEKLKCGKSKNI